MNKKFLISAIISAFLFFSVSLLYAEDMADIQAAIISQEYEKANSLAKDYLAKPDLTPSQHNEAQYYSGLSYLYAGDYVQARKSLKQLIQSGPQNELRDQTYIALFNSYFLAGDYQEALRVIHKAVKASSHSQYTSTFYLKFARVFLKLSHWKKAREYLGKITAEFPDSLEASTAKQLLEEKQFYAVQVGAFVDRLRAESLMTELKSKSEYAYIVETIDPDNTVFYRVRVGQITNLDEAMNLESKLAQSGYPTQIYP